VIVTISFIGSGIYFGEKKAFRVSWNYIKSVLEKPIQENL